MTKIGPTLAGLLGRKAGSAEGFDNDSEAMLYSDLVWHIKSLNGFLADPQKFIPGNKMVTDGFYVVGQVSSAGHRADIIAYLEQATK